MMPSCRSASSAMPRAVRGPCHGYRTRHCIKKQLPSVRLNVMTKIHEGMTHVVGFRLRLVVAEYFYDGIALFGGLGWLELGRALEQGVCVYTTLTQPSNTILRTPMLCSLRKASLSFLPFMAATGMIPFNTLAAFSYCET